MAAAALAATGCACEAVERGTARPWSFLSTTSPQSDHTRIVARRRLLVLPLLLLLLLYATGGHLKAALEHEFATDGHDAPRAGLAKALARVLSRSWWQC